MKYLRDRSFSSPERGEGWVGGSRWNLTYPPIRLCNKWHSYDPPPPPLTPTLEAKWQLIFYSPPQFIPGWRRLIPSSFPLKTMWSSPKSSTSSPPLRWYAVNNDWSLGSSTLSVLGRSAGLVIERTPTWSRDQNNAAHGGGGETKVN